MRLTAYTDYTLRTLMYLAISRDRLVTIQDIADLHNISKNHLTKVVYHLGVTGIVETVRGRNGGLRLKKEPADINIGEVVRGTETDFFMAECFDRDKNQCVFTSNCKLKAVLRAATTAYLDVLDSATLESLLSENGGRSKKSAAVSPIRIHARAKAK